jgi:hypothetical protein
MNTMFWLPITEMEIESVVESLKGKRSAGFDEVPEFLVKRCIHYIKKPLVHIFNVSLNSGVFPEKMKIAKIRPLYKKGKDRKRVITGLSQSYLFSLKYWKDWCTTEWYHL